MTTKLTSSSILPFLRKNARLDRLPDYIIVEGPLAGGHLGFGADDWDKHDLRTIVAEIAQYLQTEKLDIPLIPAGGIFTGSDAVSYLENGAAAVQVATRFTVTHECGLPDGRIRWSDAALRSMVTEYTYEAGVRNLERQVGATCRKAALVYGGWMRRPPAAA